MREKDRKAKVRATWLEAYNTLGSVSKVAIRCGIARSILYPWLKHAKNEQNLLDYSHRPKKLAHQKISSELEMLILRARQNFDFGPQRIEAIETLSLSSPTMIFYQVLKNLNLQL